MPVPVLPEELIAHIISYLPRGSLHAAALTAWTWLLPIRRQLFRTIFIHYHRIEFNVGQAETFLDIVDRFGTLIEEVIWPSLWCSGPVHDKQHYHDRVISAKEAYQRLAVLSCKHNLIHGIDSHRHESTAVYIAMVLDIVPDLASYFRWVVYDPRLIKEEGNDEVIAASVTALQLLPNLQTLTLGDGSSYNGKEVLPSTLFTNHIPFSSIASLELNNWMMLTPEDEICRFLAKFIHLVKLTIRYMFFQVENWEQHAPLLRYLDIQMSPPWYEYGYYKGRDSGKHKLLLKWLALQRDVLPLDTLIINAYQFDFAQGFHRTLKRLHLSDVTAAQNLALFTELTDLHIQTTSVTIRVMTKTVQSIRSDILEYLTLDFFSPPDMSLDHLREVLDQPRFRRLRDLRISISVDEGGFVLKDIVKTWVELPRLCPE